MISITEKKNQRFYFIHFHLILLNVLVHFPLLNGAHLNQ